KGFGGNVASRKIADAVGAAAKTISIHSVSKPTGGLESRQQSGEEAMAEKVAKQAIDFQASATQWAKETPLAPIFDAQLEYGKKFVERSASAARSLWRLQ